MTTDEIPERQVRAISEEMTVIEIAENLYEVFGENGNDGYVVDTANSPSCTCPDFQHREPEGGCKHVRRVRIEQGEESLEEIRERLRKRIDRLESEASRMNSEAQDLRYTLESLREVAE
jgi:predicted nucleic acid-binding Zn finger protein